MLSMVLILWGFFYSIVVIYHQKRLKSSVFNQSLRLLIKRKPLGLNLWLGIGI